MSEDTKAEYSEGTIESYPNGAGTELEYYGISVAFIYSF